MRFKSYWARTNSECVGIENFYKERTRNIIYQAFGEPDELRGNFYRYEGVSVGGKMCSVLFKFVGKMNTAIAVTRTNE